MMIARLLACAGLLTLALAATPALADTPDKPWTLQEALGDPEGLTITASLRALRGAA